MANIRKLIVTFQIAGTELERLWRTRLFVSLAAAARGGGSVPVCLLPDANLLLHLGASYTQLCGAELSTGRRLWSLELEVAATRIWAEGRTVVLLTGGLPDTVGGFTVLQF